MKFFKNNKKTQTLMCKKLRITKQTKKTKRLQKCKLLKLTQLNQVSIS